MAPNTGTPLTRNSEPVPEEQLGVDERVKLNAARHYATKEYMSHGEPLARRAESRVHEAEERAGSLLGQVVDGAHDLKEKAKGRAEELADKAREGYEKGEQKIKRAVDDGVDRAGEVKVGWGRMVTGAVRNSAAVERCLFNFCMVKLSWFDRSQAVTITVPCTA